MRIFIDDRNQQDLRDSFQVEAASQAVEQRHQVFSTHCHGSHRQVGAMPDAAASIVDKKPSFHT